MSIHYRISLDRPEAHLFHVELELAKPRAGEWVFHVAYVAAGQLHDSGYGRRPLGGDHAR